MMMFVNLILKTWWVYQFYNFYLRFISYSVILYLKHALCNVIFSNLNAQQIWSRPRIGGHIPSGRYGHSSTLLSDGKIVVFGGWGKSGCQTKEMINDSKAYSIQILDTKTMTWFVPRKLGYKEVKHLYNHSACKASGSTIFILAGFDGRQALSDFYTLNIE